MTMTLDERIRRGLQAERLLADEMFLAASRAVDQTIRDDMFKTKPEETVKRDWLYAESKGFQRVVERLRAWVSDGQLAAAEAAQKS